MINYKRVDYSRLISSLISLFQLSIQYTFFYLLFIFISLFKYIPRSTQMFGFPFGGFGGMSHDDDDDDEPQQQVDNQKYYDILGLNKNASLQQIKKKYKTLAKQLHPDRKNGDVKKFQQLNEAYQTLSDPEKRKIYDKYGTKGPQSGGQQDLLNMFFGGGRGSRRGATGGRKQMAKVKPTQKALEVTLQDIYNGKIVKLQHTRTRCCEKCDGKGGQQVQKCKQCKGKGMVIQMYQMGPGMYQQVQKHCDKCSGQGQIISEASKCKVCNGKKIMQKKKTIEVPIEKGTPNNHPITMAGEGNQIPDAMAGDLILVVQQKQHSTFTRKGADLFMKKDITLIQALTGLEFTLTHLDGHEYSIYTKKGQILSDKTKKVVGGLGMPFFKDSLSHGNLIIEFHVVMPKRGSLTGDQLKELVEILPGKVNPRPADDKYQMLEDFRKQDTNTSEQGGHKNEQEEEFEEQEEAGGTRCQTQ